MPCIVSFSHLLSTINVTNHHLVDREFLIIQSFREIRFC